MTARNSRRGRYTDRKRPRARPVDRNAPKQPDDWVTANEPMTVAQASYCDSAGFHNEKYPGL